MRAAPDDEIGFALFIAEENQFFGEHLHFNGCAASRELASQGDRLPVTPHEIATRRSRAGTTDQIVLFVGQHEGIPFFV
jgi:hypothetical protein